MRRYAVLRRSKTFRGNADAVDSASARSRRGRGLATGFPRSRDHCGEIIRFDRRRDGVAGRHHVAAGTAAAGHGRDERPRCPSHLFDAAAAEQVHVQIPDECHTHAVATPDFPEVHPGRRLERADGVDAGADDVVEDRPHVAVGVLHAPGAGLAVRMDGLGEQRQDELPKLCGRHQRAGLVRVVVRQDDHVGAFAHGETREREVIREHDLADAPREGRFVDVAREQALHAAEVPRCREIGRGDDGDGASPPHAPRRLAYGCQHGVPAGVGGTQPLEVGHRAHGVTHGIREQLAHHPLRHAPGIGVRARVPEERASNPELVHDLVRGHAVEVQALHEVEVVGRPGAPNDSWIDGHLHQWEQVGSSAVQRGEQAIARGHRAPPAAKIRPRRMPRKTCAHAALLDTARPRPHSVPTAPLKRGEGVLHVRSHPHRTERFHPGYRRAAQRERPVRRPGPYPVPARAQRLPSHRPRQGHPHRLRHRGAVRGPLQPPLRRHQPRKGRAGVRRRHPGGHPLARLRLGGPRVLRLRLLRADVRVGRAADPQGQGLRLRPLRGPDPRVPGHRRGRQGPGHRHAPRA